MPLTKNINDVLDWIQSNAPDRMSAIINARSPGFTERAVSNIPKSLNKILPTADDYKHPNRLIDASINTALNAPMMGMFIGPKSALWDKEAANKALAMLGKGESPSLVWEKTRIGKLPSGGLFSEISDQGLTINPLARNAKTGQAFTEGLGTGGIIEHPELEKAYPELNKLGTIIMGNKGALGSFSPRSMMIKLSPESFNSSKSIRETAAHELQHAVSHTEGWPSGGSPTDMNINDFADFYKTRLASNKKQESDAILKGNNKLSTLAKEVYDTLYKSAQQDAYEKLSGEALSNETGNRLSMALTDRQQWYPMMTGKLGGIKVADLINKYDLPVNSLSANIEDSKNIIQKLLKEQALTDRPTMVHEARVGAIVRKLSREAGLNEEMSNKLRAAALGHDIGKTEIPLDVLHKVGKLTDEEFSLIKKHPEISGRILLENNVDSNIAELARSHHMQQTQGKGYPSHEGMPIEGTKYLQAADIMDSLVGGAGLGHDYPLRFKGEEMPRTVENINLIMDDMAKNNEIDASTNILLKHMLSYGKFPKKLINILKKNEIN